MDVRDAFFNEVGQIALQDRNVVFLTADMGALALNNYPVPERFINVGIAEQNLISLAAGMTLAGKKVYAYGIAAFLIYRAFDQIRCNLSGMNLPVTLVGAGPGLAYGSDGPSHHCVYDIPIMSQLPNMVILTPHDADSAIEAAQFSYASKNPSYIRLSKGSMPEKYGSYRDACSRVPFLMQRFEEA